MRWGGGWLNWGGEPGAPAGGGGGGAPAHHGVDDAHVVEGLGEGGADAERGLVAAQRARQVVQVLVQHPQVVERLRAPAPPEPGGGRPAAAARAGGPRQGCPGSPPRAVDVGAAGAQTGFGLSESGRPALVTGGRWGPEPWNAPSAPGPAGVLSPRDARAAYGRRCRLRRGGAFCWWCGELHGGVAAGRSEGCAAPHPPGAGRVPGGEILDASALCDVCKKSGAHMNCCGEILDAATAAGVADGQRALGRMGRGWCAGRPAPGRTGASAKMRVRAVERDLPRRAAGAFVETDIAGDRASRYCRGC